MNGSRIVDRRRWKEAGSYGDGTRMIWLAPQPLAVMPIVSRSITNLSIRLRRVGGKMTSWIKIYFLSMYISLALRGKEKSTVATVKCPPSPLSKRLGGKTSGWESKRLQQHKHVCVCACVCVWEANKCRLGWTVDHQSGAILFFLHD